MPINELYQHLDPVAFRLGALEIRWYGLAYLAGFVLGALLIIWLNKRWKLNLKIEDIVTVVVGVGFGAIIGARLGYVLLYNADFYLAHPDQILAFSQGGMSFHGGLIGAIIGGGLAAKGLHIALLTMLDLGCIVAPVGLFFGRIANFINGELWGKPTDSWVGVYFETGGGIARHPSQLYEALLEGLVLFILLILLAKKTPPRPQGTFAGVFFLVYGIFRIAVEFVRVPDVQLGYLFGPITLGMLLSLPLIAVGFSLLVWAHKTKRPQRGYSTSKSHQAPTAQPN